MLDFASAIIFFLFIISRAPKVQTNFVLPPPRSTGSFRLGAQLAETGPGLRHKCFKRVFLTTSLRTCEGWIEAILFDKV
jgi:hypothetical protein